MLPMLAMIGIGMIRLSSIGAAADKAAQPEWVSAASAVTIDSAQKKILTGFDAHQSPLIEESAQSNPQSMQRQVKKWLNRPKISITTNF